MHIRCLLFAICLLCLHFRGLLRSGDMDSRRGGLRKRVADVGSSDYSDPIVSASASSSGSRSLRRRIADSTPPAASKAALLLNRAMRRDWAKGKLPSNKVLEYSLAASKQGAHDVIRAKDTWDEGHAHRDLLSALGWPEKAPDIKWIAIPVGPNGDKRPHPVICPIEAFKKLFDDFPRKWQRAVRGQQRSLQSILAVHQTSSDCYQASCFEPYDV